MTTVPASTVVSTVPASTVVSTVPSMPSIISAATSSVITPVVRPWVHKPGIVQRVIIRVIVMVGLRSGVLFDDFHSSGYRWLIVLMDGISDKCDDGKSRYN
jgi:hypothetical protein